MLTTARRKLRKGSLNTTCLRFPLLMKAETYWASLPSMMRWRFSCQRIGGSDYLSCSVDNQLRNCSSERGTSKWQSVEQPFGRPEGVFYGEALEVYVTQWPGGNDCSHTWRSLDQE